MLSTSAFSTINNNRFSVDYIVFNIEVNSPVILLKLLPSDFLLNRVGAFAKDLKG